MTTNIPKKAIPNNDAYWTALGRFVQSYSSAEAIMQELLWQKAEVTSEVARAVFSGVRIREAMNHIKRIYEAKGDEGFDIIEPALKQLAEITSARNDILHYGARFVDGEPKFVTNKRAAHVPERARRFPVSAEILGQMTADLAVIMTQIDFFLMHGAMPDKMLRQEFYEAFSMPWQYKHSPVAGRRI